MLRPQVREAGLVVLGVLAFSAFGHAQDRARGPTLLGTTSQIAHERASARTGMVSKTFGSGPVTAVIESDPPDASGCWHFRASLTGELANVQSVRWSFGSGDARPSQTSSGRANGFQVYGRTCRAEPFRAELALKRARRGSRTAVVDGDVPQAGGDSLPEGLSFERGQQVETLENETPMGVRATISLKGSAAALAGVRSVEYRSNQPNWRGGWYPAPNVNGFTFDGALPPGRWTVTARIRMKDGRQIERRFDIDAAAHELR